MCAPYIYIYDISHLRVKVASRLDVRGSVHHSKIHTKKSNKMKQCIKSHYSIFI